MDRLKSALLVLMCLMAASESSAQKLITIYGLENGSQLQGGRSNDFSYQLSLGAFKSHDNAIKCKNHFQEKTQAGIQIKSSGSVFLVILGPFDNAAALRAASNQLLSNKAVNMPRPVQRVTEKESLISKDAFVQEQKSFIPVVTVGAASIWTTGGLRQSEFFEDYKVRTYVPNENYSNGASAEIFVGVQTDLPSQFLGQAGLAIAATNQLTLSGEIWDDGVPEFNNHSYNYQVKHEHILLKGKLLKAGEYFVTPWIGGGIGVGFNHTSQYTNNPLITKAEATPNFSSARQTTFSYSLSAGIQHAISKNLQIGLGYEYIGWGRVKLGSVDGQTADGRLNISNLVTSGLLLNFTYTQV